LARAFADDRENAISRGVAPLVVDLLEAVEIEHEQHDAARGAARPRDFLLEPIGEQPRNISAQRLAGADPGERAFVDAPDAGLQRSFQRGHREGGGRSRLPRRGLAGEVGELHADALEAVLGMHAVDHLAMQLRFALELHQGERREGQDHQGRDGEPGGSQARRGGQHSLQPLATVKAARAAASVASMSAGAWALDTNPASYAEGAR
jgi:hypothetical protein